MVFALGWIALVSLLALWSLLVWSLHAATVWALSGAGAVSGAASGTGATTLPDWLAPWVPAALLEPVARLLANLQPLVDSLLQAVPAIAGGVTVTAWVVWGIGAGLLVLLGSGLHLSVLVWRRRRTGTGPTGRRLSAAD